MLDELVEHLWILEQSLDNPNLTDEERKEIEEKIAQIKAALEGF